MNNSYFINLERNDLDPKVENLIFNWFKNEGEFHSDI